MLNVLLFIAFIFCCQTALAEPGMSSLDDAQSPNVVIFYVDDLGYGDLSSYGHPVVKTPHIDQLANEGIKSVSDTPLTLPTTPYV